MLLRDFDLPMPSYGETFRQIRFLQPLETVREYVETCLPRFALAIHVRRGDSFRTPNRFGGGFIDKHLPLPIIRRILNSRTGDKPVLLIGNEMALIRSLQTKPSIYSLADFPYPGEVLPEKSDLFDFCALAKCDAILGGTSKFARYAGLVGGANFPSLSDFLSDEEIKSCLLEYITRPPDDDEPLEAALACQYAQHFVSPMLTIEERELLLERAFRADPENPIYPMRVAADNLRKQDFQGAADVLASAAKRGTLHTLLDVARMSLSGNPDVNFGRLVQKNGFLTQNDWEAIEAHSEVTAWADYYVGLRFVSLGEEQAATKFFARADSILGVGPSWFDRQEFATMAIQAIKVAKALDIAVPDARKRDVSSALSIRSLLNANRFCRPR